MTKLNDYLRENYKVFTFLMTVMGAVASATFVYTNLDRDTSSNSTRIDHVESESENQSIEISDLKLLVAEAARISAENGKEIAELKESIAGLKESIAETAEIVSANSRLNAENSKEIAELKVSIAENGRLIAENGRLIAENGRQVAALTSYAYTKADSQDEKIEKLGEEFKVLDSKSEELEDENFELKINQLNFQNQLKQLSDAAGNSNTE